VRDLNINSNFYARPSRNRCCRV